MKALSLSGIKLPGPDTHRNVGLIPRGARLPVEVVQEGSRFLGLCLVWGSIVLLGVAVVFLSAPFLTKIGAWRYYMSGLCTLLGVGLLIDGIARFWTARWRFAETDVSCALNSPFCHREWTEPLSAYKGIYRKVIERQSGASPVVFEYEILLEHKFDEDRTVKLYNSRSDEDWFMMQEFYLRLLKVPRLADVHKLQNY